MLEELMRRRWDRLMPVAIIGAVLLVAVCAMQWDLTPMQAAETRLKTPYPHTTLPKPQ